ncbi:MAG: hypothetical protein AUG75_10905 [Cyanobacteria bacterium 13_1_20CM_4_61_6]|nr:MAG: hypothetical protein AUG75_10905 [Cyanobacteria bacterium 13_1_20CM_4_61_6]
MVTTSRTQPSAPEIIRWMQDSVADALNVARESLDPTAPFTSYGLDSIAAFTLTVGLAEWLDRDLPASLFWEFATIAELADHLAETNELTSP